MWLNKVDYRARVRCSFLLIGFAALCLAVAAEAQTFSVIFAFSYPGPNTPLSGITMDAAGDLYGTTLQYGDSAAI
jgi:hypothetical protein